MGRGTIAIAVALALAALGLGCGGGGDSSTDTGSISKAAFIKKVDAVCKHGTRRMQRAVLKVLKQGKGIKRPSTDQSVKLVGVVIVPSVRQEIKEIKALGVPGGDEEKVDAMVGALEEGVETAEDDPEAVVKGSSDVIFGIASRIAGEYGIKGCSVR
jgi:hypothetical protein